MINIANSIRKFFCRPSAPRQRMYSPCLFDPLFPDKLKAAHNAFYDAYMGPKQVYYTGDFLSDRYSGATKDTHPHHPPIYSSYLGGGTVTFSLRGIAGHQRVIDLTQSVADIQRSSRASGLFLRSIVPPRRLAYPSPQRDQP